MLPAFDPMLTIIFFLNSRGIFLSLCRESVPWGGEKEEICWSPGWTFCAVITPISSSFVHGHA